MINTIKTVALTAILATTSVVGLAPQAEAGTMSCYGSSNYQTCTYSEYDYQSGQYVTCYGSITKYSENWNCY